MSQARFGLYAATLIVVVLLVMLASACSGKSPSNKVELTVSAAASLTDSLMEIQTLYEKKHNHIKLLFNFGSSGTLQRQIEQGAPADLIMSAGKKQMNALIDKQLIEPGSSADLLENELVVVVPADNEAKHADIASIEDLNKPEIKWLAIGFPETVPAGSYTKETLIHFKLWDELQPKLLLSKDVRQVLTYVETGNADAGFVYRTDALTSDKVGIAFAVNSVAHEPIVYPAGIVKATKHPDEAKVLFDYLRSEEAQEVFVKYGFSKHIE